MWYKVWFNAKRVIPSVLSDMVKNFCKETYVHEVDCKNVNCYIDLENWETGRQWVKVTLKDEPAAGGNVESSH